MKINRVEAEFLAGTSIEKAVTEAKEFSIANNNCIVSFDFNGVRCEIKSNAIVKLACEQYSQICSAKVDGLYNEQHKGE
jgi:hypothetical protein